MHPRLPEKILKQEVINNTSECNRTMEISPRLSLEITARTGGIPHSSSSSGMLIFQLSFLDLSCSGSHQPTCAGAARPGLNKLEPPPRLMPFIRTLPYAHHPCAGSSRMGVAPHCRTLPRLLPALLPSPLFASPSLSPPHSIHFYEYLNANTGMENMQLGH